MESAVTKETATTMSRRQRIDQNSSRVAPLGDSCFGARLSHEPERNGSEVVRSEWLRQEGVCSASVSALSRLLLSVGSEHQHLEFASPHITADAVEDFPAIHSRETDIKDEQVGRILEGSFQPGRTIVTRINLYPSGSETHSDQPLDNG
jgi:hypothetical protein